MRQSWYGQVVAAAPKFGAGRLGVPVYRTREVSSSMRSTSLALYLTAAVVALSVLFVAFALSGADLCLWCGIRD
jgi:hypothetical protein